VVTPRDRLSTRRRLRNAFLERYRKMSRTTRASFELRPFRSMSSPIFSQACKTLL